ncbi:MAG: acetolactate synthase small subunit [Faecalimonas sp.]|nr:acetolactate synthase small subunit [Faecalimonas sp.]
MRKQVISILVENNAGLLGRVAGLFSRRGYNIDSITCGTTTDESIARITVVAQGDEQSLAQIRKQVAKLEEVMEVKVLEDGLSVCRELIMVQVKADATQRAEIVSLADIFRAKIVDVEVDSLMLEMTGTQSKVEAFLDLLSTYEILELARTGITGLARGGKEAKMFEDD